MEEIVKLEYDNEREVAIYTFGEEKVETPLPKLYKDTLLNELKSYIETYKQATGESGGDE